MNLQKVGAWVLLLAAAGCVQAQAPSAPTAVPVPARDDLQTVVSWLEDRLQRALTVSADHAADADLRAAVDAMIAHEMPRLRRVLASWVEEERALGLEEGVSNLFTAVSYRMQNEIGYWLIDSAGPEHDRRQQLALARPQACASATRIPTLLDELVQVWQQVPAAQRAAYLRSEGELLQRWGLPRTELPPRPREPVEAAAWQLIDDYVHQQKPLPDPMPPLLAWRLLSEPPDESQRRRLDTLCVLRQWALGTALRQGQGALGADQWLAHRYARLPQYRTPDDEAVKPDAYPEMARRLRVEGDVTVEITVDAEGKKLQTRVARREIRVPGIRGQRPVVFETLLDAASLARAAAHPTPRPEKLLDGRAVFNVKYVYKLQ